MNTIGVILLDPDERAALCLKAAIPWEDKGFAFIGVYPGPLACPPRGAFEHLLVISEINLPGIPRLEVFSRLRSLYPEACLAILTSEDDLLPALEAFRHGVARYLLKPFKLEQIFELLTAAGSVFRRGTLSVPPGLLKSDRNAGIAGRVQAYVECHYTDQRLTLKSVAQEFHLNYSYLSSLFKKQTGMTYSDYVSALRIRFVKELLKDKGMKMSEIAHAAGFNDSQVLYYAFKNATGTTPGMYRDCLTPKKERLPSGNI